MTVNGELIGAPAPPNGHKKQRTYFRTITILVNKPERSYLEIDLTSLPLILPVLETETGEGACRGQLLLP